MQLYTANNFTVVRQIADHTDATVYYVRAVIRNAYTDDIIATLDLESKGSQRYKKDWKVPPDPSGEGFYISIVTSVYTDANHTTKSSLYGDEENTHLVSDKPVTRGGGGISARLVRDIFQEEFEKMKGELKPKDDSKALKAHLEQFSGVLKAIEGLKQSLKPEKPEKIDFKPILEAIKLVQKTVEDIDIPEPEKLDLTSIVKLIEKLNDEVYSSVSQKKFMNIMSRAANEAFSKLDFVTTFVTSARIGKEKMREITPPAKKEKTEPKKEEKKVEEEGFDITKLDL